MDGDFSRSPKRRKIAPNLPGQVRVRPALDVQTENLSASTGHGKKPRYNSHRASTACTTCKVKKVKCDEGHPTCSFCLRQGFRCDYPSQTQSNRDVVLDSILQKLSEFEEKLSAVTSGNTLRGHHDEVTTPQSLARAESRLHEITPILDKPSAPVLSIHKDPQDLDTPVYLCSPPESFYDKNQSPESGHSPDGIASRVLQHRYYENRSPISCEESRNPLPDLLPRIDSISKEEILVYLDRFFEDVCPRFPIICEQVTLATASQLLDEGFVDGLPKCLILTMVAIAHAYEDNGSLEAGIREFQMAQQVLLRLPAQFSMEYAQAKILSALFLLKKGRLLDFWENLYAGCTNLYTMLNKNKLCGIEQNAEDTKTTRRLFWICYNLEKDLKNEITALPRSPLATLADILPLPLGCDENRSAEMELKTRTIYTCFLAEMSLKAILSRILETPKLELCIQKSYDGNIEISPVFREYKTQLDEWVAGLPKFLGWSEIPSEGTTSQILTRLKFTYWFARFAMIIPLISQVLYDPNYQLPFFGWSFFQEGLHAGFNLVKTVVEEDADIDVIMGIRLLSSISFLKPIKAKCNWLTSWNDSGDELLREGINLLWDRLAFKSEYLTCRLYMLDAII